VIALTRLRERLAAAGVPHPELAAAVLVARGRRLLDQRAFAELLGVPVAHLRSWESGSRSPTEVPRRIAAVAPELDWPAAGVTPPGDPSDPASRHPSARRS
jgi:transcriptional regulator with XRE-family HTH domain